MAQRSQGPLTRQRIFDAALAVADRDGGQAVTMRRVARELGVEAMSLYHHLRDREELLDGLAETMVRAGVPAPPTGLDTRTLLSSFGHGIRATALAHPDAFHLVGLRPLRNPAAAASVTALLKALGTAGLPPDRAVSAYRLVAAYARGFALSEIAGLTFGPRVDTPIPADLKPYAAALQRDTGTVFETGLETIIAGIERPPRRSS